MSSSSIPTLSDVLFYTSTDPYNYLTDNRPIQQLSDNINTTAAALVGIGYGEHSSVSGALIAQGKAVELQVNGNIAYPSPIASIKTGIYGLVIGSTNGGLNKVIWRSSLLDLEVLGLQGIIPGATPDQVLIADTTTGTISAIGSGSVTPTMIVLGSVLTFPYISIGNSATASLTVDPSAKENLLHNYGVTRRQNFNLLSTLDALPVQFTKTVFRTTDHPLTGQGTRNMNPLLITLTDGTGTVNIDTTTADVTTYNANNWILKEKFTRFTTVAGTLTDVDVKVNSGAAIANTWVATAYPATFPISSSENFELSSTSAVLLSKFHITKYYQYPKASGTTTTKPIVIVTILDSSLGEGGELNTVAICDFITYATGEIEDTKKRVVLVGAAAAAFYAAFPTELVNL